MVRALDIAWRLLKEEKPWDMYSDWRYLKNPDNPDLRSDEPFTCGLYPEHHRLAGEINTDSMFGGCGKTKPLSEFTQHILTNPQWKTSGQRGPSHPDYGKIGPEQVICNDCKARSYARFAPLANAIQEHIEENPDFDPNTQELGKLPPGMKIPNEALVDPDEDKWRSDIETGEPMDIAFQLLKNEPYHLMSNNALATLAAEGDEAAYAEMIDRMGDWVGTDLPPSPEAEEWIEEQGGPFQMVADTMESGKPPEPPEGLPQAFDEHYMSQPYYPPDAMADMYASETGQSPYKKQYTNKPRIQLPIMTPIHRDESGLTGWQYKNASEPMDIAMRLLKRDNTTDLRTK